MAISHDDIYVALRLTIFEYLLPLQRKRRVALFLDSCKEEDLDVSMCINKPAEIFEYLLVLSDRLLSKHGFATSYIYPYTLRHENPVIDCRQTVSALVDAEGPFVWNPTCKRRADPIRGIRVFKAGAYMSSGRLP